LYDHFHEVIPSNFGRGLNRDFLTQMLEQTGYAKKAKLAPNRFYFGWTFSEAEAVEQINTIVEEIAQKLNES
jgi:hypothetical protein